MHGNMNIRHTLIRSFAHSKLNMNSQWSAPLSKNIRNEPHTEIDECSASFVRFHSFNFAMPTTEFVGTIKDLALI